MAEGVVNLNSATWESEIVQYKGVALVDFWAPWCGPCRALAPVLEELAKDMEGQVRIVKVNVDENQAVPAKFAIRSIPTLILFNKGEVQEQITGGLPKAALKDLILKKTA